jgi:phosphohistidine phosphatase
MNKRAWVEGNAMDLFILRHGIAGEHGDPRYPDDSKRPLTDKGKQKLLEAVRAMQKLELKLDVILSSPYKRASQTAEIVAKKYTKSKLGFSNELRPEGKFNNLIKHLKQFDSDSGVMLVGHEPYLSELISLLISGDARSGLQLKKGGLCKLGVERLTDGRCATLEWLLTPAQMERIAAG